VTVPAGGLTGAISIVESLILRVTDALDVSVGIDESLTVTEMVYVPAVAGTPDSCPEALSVKPGGSDPAVQLKGAVPPEAVNV
jgi:hypothetical protein